MPRGKREPEWKRERVALLREEGLTAAVIAKRLGVSSAFVSWVMRERGLAEPRPGRPSKEE